MKTLPIGELKTHFSEVIDDVKEGAEYVITYGRKKENVAVLIPYSQYNPNNVLKLGLLKDKSYSLADDFKMTEEELIGL